MLKKQGKILLGIVVSFTFLATGVWAGMADPTGARTLSENPAAPVDYVWVLLCAFLVFLMQGGFAMVESGFCRAKNAINLMAKNLMDFVIGSLAYMMIGFALMFGTSMGGIIGSTGWFLTGTNYDVGRYLLYMFQVVFAATAATIVSGAVAERLKIKAYLTYSAVVSALIYPIYGHWVWGGGWLSQLPFGLGHLDFAGSGVVHTVGGMVGLAGAIVLGPRFGKFINGKPRAIPGHSLTMAALGVFILWFGWFGFNVVTGLFYGGGAGQPTSQAIGAAVAVGWAFTLGYLLFKIMDTVFGVRVSPQVELQGLDVSEHGGSAYANFPYVEE